MTTLPPTQHFEVNHEVVRLSKRAFDETATITCKLSFPHPVFPEEMHALD